MSTEERLLIKAMEFVKEACPNHIREFAYKSKPGSYWAVSRLGMVWYDPDSDHETFQDAFEALVLSKYTNTVAAEKQSSKLEIEMQELRGKVEEANLVLQKAILAHVEERAKLEARIKELEAR